jgi:hypothetical protein
MSMNESDTILKLLLEGAQEQTLAQAVITIQRMSAGSLEYVLRRLSSVWGPLECTLDSGNWTYNWPGCPYPNAKQGKNDSIPNLMRTLLTMAAMDAATGGER